MSGKFVIVLLLAVQVSLSFCSVSEPSEELVKKYDDVKTAFYKRILQVYNKVHDTVKPLLEDSDAGKEAKQYFEEFQNRPNVQTFVKVVKNIAEEASPLVDKTRTLALGLYEEYARPYVGPYLDQAITRIRSGIQEAWPADN